MKKLFGLMMFVVMLFCFSSVSMAGGELLPSNLKAQYDSGVLSDTEFCDKIAEYAMNIMGLRQMGYAKRTLLMETHELYEGYDLKYTTLFIHKSYEVPQYHSEEYLLEAFTSFSDGAWDYCQGNMLD